MNNQDELSECLNELEKLSKIPNLDTLEKRKKQIQVFLSNGSGKSEPYKEIMSGITATSMQIQYESKEKDKSLDDIINENDNLNQKQKELLIYYKKDLEYLLPIGAAGTEEILPLLFDENTINFIKFCFKLVLGFSIATYPIIKTTNSLIDTKTKYHNSKKAKIESKLAEIALNEKKKTLSRKDRNQY